MNTDQKHGLQRAEETKLLLKAETEKILGFAFEVLNEVGHGLNEKITKLRVGLILNFKHARLEWQRVVL